MNNLPDTCIVCNEPKEIVSVRKFEMDGIKLEARLCVDCNKRAIEDEEAAKRFRERMKTAPNVTRLNKSNIDEFLRKNRQ